MILLVPYLTANGWLSLGTINAQIQHQSVLTITNYVWRVFEGWALRCVVISQYHIVIRRY